MSITASKSRILGGGISQMMFDDLWERSAPGRVLKLERIGRKKFIVRYPFGTVQAIYRCGYPEAQRRFAVFVVTRALTK